MRTVTRVDLYARLGVASSAHTAEIGAAFRARAKQLHPDLVDGDAERFKELSHAYGVLSDPERRYRYDRERQDTTTPRGAVRSAAASPATPPRPTPFLATANRARAALGIGLLLVAVGIALTVIVPMLPEATHGSTLGRDITLWLSAAKFVVCGAILAAVGHRRLSRLMAATDQMAT